jgi:SAM-dependent methyltransferase
MPQTDDRKETDLKRVETHFEFGKNWSSYAELIGQPQIDEAKKGLLKLLTADELRGHSFLDIGCGSGLHALAAAQLGVARIQAFDIDPDSVATTKAVLTRHAVSVPWQAEQVSVFDLDPDRHGRFDVVYSWGVLHHTGDMNAAIEKAASLVAPDGHLALALYRRTRADAFWVREKRWYASASPGQQSAARGVYRGFMRLMYRLRGNDFNAYVANYKSSRGMDFDHDVHDWLGGYPYESILASELGPRLEALGFTPVRVFAGELTRGLLGSGCDEYVYRRTR